MKKNIFLLFAACLLSMGQAMADNRVTVNDVYVPQGGQATIEIGASFETEYTAFELQIALPEGLSLTFFLVADLIVINSFNFYIKKKSLFHLFLNDISLGLEF